MGTGTQCILHGPEVKGVAMQLCFESATLSLVVCLCNMKGSQSNKKTRKDKIN